MRTRELVCTSIVTMVVLMGSGGPTAAADGCPSTLTSGECVKFIDRGSDATHLTLVVVGDGYSKGHRKEFFADATDIVKSLLDLDLYKANRDRFNVYVVSNDSKDNEVGIDVAGDTAYHTYYGRQGTPPCRLVKSADTDRLIANRLVGIKRDYTIALVQVPSQISFGGGCAEDAITLITPLVDGGIPAHELGHIVGKLYDEYTLNASAYPAGRVLNEANCTTVTSPMNVVWHDLIASSVTAIPTTPDISTPDEVGGYSGCALYADGIYRPTLRCRMNLEHTRQFCAVCYREMSGAIARYQQPPLAGSFLHFIVKLEDRERGDKPRIEVLAADNNPPPSQYDRGSFIITLSGDGWKFSRILPARPFQVRAYLQSGHTMAPVASSVVDVYIPSKPGVTAGAADIKLFGTAPDLDAGPRIDISNPFVDVSSLHIIRAYQADELIAAYKAYLASL